jgi:hypothetical protein
MSQFAEHYRLLLYSISDFFVGIALLYLFYHQGNIAKAKMHEKLKLGNSVKTPNPEKAGMKGAAIRMNGKDKSMVE